MDDFDLAFAPDSDASQDTGQAAGTPDAGQGTPPTPDNQDDGTTQDTTADTDAKAKAADEGKGVGDPELEPYKGLLESRKWNPKDPKFAPTVLKSYQEAEAYAKRRESENKLVSAAREAHASRLRGDLDSINQYRKSQGLPAIRGEKPLEDRHKEHETLIESVNAVLRNPQDAEAMSKLDSMLTKAREDLMIERARASDRIVPDAKIAFENRRTTSSSNFNTLVGKNPEAATHIDALSNYFEPGHLFDSINADVLDVTQSPEQLAELAEIGQAVHVFKNLEKIVSDRVEAEIERRRVASASPGTGRQPKGNPKPQVNDLSPVEMAFLS